MVLFLLSPQSFGRKYRPPCERLQGTALDICCDKRLAHYLHPTPVAPSALPFSLRSPEPRHTQVLPMRGSFRPGLDQASEAQHDKSAAVAPPSDSPRKVRTSTPNALSHHMQPVPIETFSAIARAIPQWPSDRRLQRWVVAELLFFSYIAPSDKRKDVLAGTL